MRRPAFQQTAACFGGTFIETVSESTPMVREAHQLFYRYGVSPSHLIMGWLQINANLQQEKPITEDHWRHMLVSIQHKMCYRPPEDNINFNNDPHQFLGSSLIESREEYFEMNTMGARARVSAELAATIRTDGSLVAILYEPTNPPKMASARVENANEWEQGNMSGFGVAGKAALVYDPQSGQAKFKNLSSVLAAVNQMLTQERPEGVMTIIQYSPGDFKPFNECVIT